uniref:Uncharacterized protein n=1 Tax=Anguilla anguilla TaxID=7936 RepID=A0A0E9W1W2_ANGAN
MHIKNDLQSLVGKNLTGLFRALTSTPSNTFWAELEYRLQTRPNAQTH